MSRFLRRLTMVVTAAALTSCGPRPDLVVNPSEGRGAAYFALRMSAPAREGRGALGVSSPPPGALLEAPAEVASATLATGRFLIASRRLTGSVFSRTVVLLLDHRDDGTLGVIVNRPTGTSLTRLLPELARLGRGSDTVYLGGPVDPEVMVFLIRAGSAPPDSRLVLGDVHATGSVEALRQVIDQHAPTNRFHAYVGYAGWGPGQLDAEVVRGDWFVAEASPELIFDPKITGLWDRLIRELEGVQVRSVRPPRLAAFSLGDGTARGR
jgi:putative transcriptional regulator